MRDGSGVRKARKMKSQFLLEEILATAAPEWVTKKEILDALAIGAHRLWQLKRNLVDLGRPVEESRHGLRYPEPPCLPLWFEQLGGIGMTRPSRGTKRILIQEACEEQTVMTIVTKRHVHRILPFDLREDGVVIAAEVPKGDIARAYTTNIDTITLILEVRQKYMGSAHGLRRSLGL